MSHSAPPLELVEVAPRDGLQNERRTLTVDRKLELIDRARRAGARRIEVTSFVHPKRVPQMGDAEAVIAGLPAHLGVTYSALALNERGYERAAAAGVREVNTVVLCSETFSQRNQGMSVADALASARRLSERGAADGIAVTVTVAAAFGCPFEGEVAGARVAWVIERVAALGVAEIVLADTIGSAHPDLVARRVALLRELAPAVRPRLHLHDTRNTGVANALAGVGAGVRSLDTSLAGIGGCPFAPAASGNVATEDLAWVLERMGWPTGLDLDALIASARWIAGELGIDPPGSLARAGRFPPEQTPR